MKLMPNQPEPLNNLGLVFEATGKLDEATDSYTKAVTLEPDNVQALGNLARACPPRRSRRRREGVAAKARPTRNSPRLADLGAEHIIATRIPSGRAVVGVARRLIEPSSFRPRNIDPNAYEAIAYMNSPFARFRALTASVTRIEDGPAMLMHQLFSGK